MEFVILAVCVLYCTALTLWTRRELKKQRADAAQARKNLPNREDVERLKASVSNLEQGIVPDFEEAKAAAKAVNDFNAGISAIMGYDPMEARRKMREGRKDDGE